MSSIQLSGSDKIVYLYIHKWDFEDRDDVNVFEGHPHVGRVYQAIKNGSTYRIPLKTSNGQTGVFIKGKSSDDNGRWNYEVEEVNEHNILRLNIKQEDLININKWDNNENKNIKHLLIERANDKMGSVEKRPDGQIKSISEIIDEEVERLNNNIGIDSDHEDDFDVVSESFAELFEAFTDEKNLLSDDVFDVSKIEESENAKSIHLHAAIKLINSYYRSDVPEFLLASMVYLMKEFVRKRES